MSIDVALIGGVGLLAVGMVLLAVMSLVFVWSIFIKEWMLSFARPRPQMRARHADVAAETTQPMGQAA